MGMCKFRIQNGQFVLNKVFLVQTIAITFTYLLALFIVQNFKKILQQIHCYEDAPFLGPKWSNCIKQIFGGKIINIILIYVLAPFIVQNLKKTSFSRSRVMIHNFWDQNGPFPQITIFPENLLMSLVSFIRAYVHAKNQSQILI